MRTIVTRVVVGAVILGTSMAATEKPVSVGLQKQLLVDDYVIAEKQNVTREPGRVKKGEVVLEPSLHTDFHPSWKRSDGIHWSGCNGGKPVSHRAADTHNRILWDRISGSRRLVTRTDPGGTGGASESRSTRIMTHTAGNDRMKHPRFTLRNAKLYAYDFN